MRLINFKLTRIDQDGTLYATITEQIRFHFWTRRKRKVIKQGKLWTYDDTGQFPPISKMFTLVSNWSKKTGIDVRMDRF